MHRPPYFVLIRAQTMDRLSEAMTTVFSPSNHSCTASWPWPPIWAALVFCSGPSLQSRVGHNRRYVV